MQVLQPVKHVDRDEPSYSLKKAHWVNPVRKDHDLKKIVDLPLWFLLIHLNRSRISVTLAFF